MRAGLGQAWLRSFASLLVCEGLLLLHGCRHRFAFDENEAAPDASTERSTSAEGDFDGEWFCANDSACPLTSLHCDAQSGRCVECILDADCTDPSAPRCDARHRCVDCLVDEDCGAGFACDRIAERCLERCLDLDDCAPEAHECDSRRQVCVLCDRDQECRDEDRPYCAAGGAGCVECRWDSQCENAEHCDERLGRCVECRDSNDCPWTSVCDPVARRCSAGG